MQLIPYLGFSGNCAEAFDFYAKALGGNVVAKMTYGQTPMAEECGPATAHWIAHAHLEAEGAVLMGADGPGADGAAQAPGTTTINVDVDSVEKAERIFAALAEGGSIKMPIAETFWAHRWGMLVDRYQVPWMVNCMKDCGPDGGAGS